MSEIDQTAPAPDSEGWELPSAAELIEMLPQYDIVDILGRGGMGAVFKGHQEKLARDVAIKLLFRHVIESDDDMKFAERFQQEAKAMARLDHPNILAVHDFGETFNGHLYLVIEFIDGMDILQYLEQSGGPIPQDHALSITAHVLDALAYAHSQGIVHRDIKPANILISQEGKVKIADFGLAKKFEEGDDLGPALTMTNVAVGTPDYVAPEVIDSTMSVDHRADLYSVGVMLYQLLTARMPRGVFRSPSELHPELDERLDEIFEKAIEADPDYRYSSAADMRADLDEVMQGVPVQKQESALAQDPAPVSQQEVIEAPALTVENTQKVAEDAVKKNSSATMILAVAIPVLLIIGLIYLIGNRGSESTMNELSSAAGGDDGKEGGLLQGVFSKSKPYENSLGMRFVPVPITGGETDGRDLLFSIWETRVKDYKEFRDDLGADAPEWKKAYLDQGDDHPAVFLNTENAEMFCEWLTKRERKGGLIGENDRYRLPTDHEWSCAVGIGALEEAEAEPVEKNRNIPDVYPWGKQWPPVPNSANLYGEEAKDVVLFQTGKTQEPIKGYNDGIPQTGPVGSLSENQYGLYDLSGNVWEFCKSRIDSGQESKSISRGGCWNSNKEYSLNSSKRLMLGHGVFPSLGFRIVLGRAEEFSSSEKTDNGSKFTTNDPLAASKDRPYENKLGMRFVPVPIIKGSTAGRNVLISIWETRLKDYKAFIKEGGGKEVAKLDFDQEPDHPVINATWDDAVAFCAWLTEKERDSGKIDQQAEYRLPTDHEWSCAAGLGEKDDIDIDPEERQHQAGLSGFWGGGGYPPDRVVGNFLGEETAVNPLLHGNGKAKTTLKGYNDGFVRTSPVGSFPANEWGIYDLGGNAWEYCDDNYNASNDRAKVIRGGGWDSVIKADLKPAYRHFAGSQAMKFQRNGFRVVLLLP